MAREDFLREANLKLILENLTGMEWKYMWECIWNKCIGNKDNSQGWKRMRRKILKLVSGKKKMRRKASQCI